MKTSKNYKGFNLPALNDDQLKEIEELKRMDDSLIDLSSVPELSDDDLITGHFVYANSLKIKKTPVHIMIDDDNLEWLKSQGKGYQPRLNRVLRWAKLNNCPIENL